MRLTLTNGLEYRLYFRHYHTQSVMIKKHRGKIDYNESEIRTVKEPVATECFLSAIDDEEDPFAPAYSYRGISVKSPEDVPNREIARVAAIKHMTSAMSCGDTLLVWDAYYDRKNGKARTTNESKRT